MSYYIVKNTKARNLRLRRNGLVTDGFDVKPEKTQGCLFSPDDNQHEFVLHPSQQLYVCSNVDGQEKETLIEKPIGFNQYYDLNYETGEATIKNTVPGGICAKQLFENDENNIFVERDSTLHLCNAFGLEPTNITQFSLYLQNLQNSQLTTKEGAVNQMRLKSVCWGQNDKLLTASFKDLLKFIDVQNLGTKQRDRNITYKFDSDLYVKCSDNEIETFFQCPSEHSFDPEKGICVQDHPCSKYLVSDSEIYNKQFRRSADINTKYIQCDSVQSFASYDCPAVENWKTIYNPNTQECEVDNTMCSTDSEILYTDSQKFGYNCQNQSLFVPSCTGEKVLTEYGELVDSTWDYNLHACFPVDCEDENIFYPIETETFVRSVSYKKCINNEIVVMAADGENGWENFIQQSTFDTEDFKDIPDPLLRVICQLIIEPRNEQIPKFVFDETTKEVRLLDIKKDVKQGVTIPLYLSRVVNVKTMSSVLSWKGGIISLALGGSRDTQKDTNFISCLNISEDCGIPALDSRQRCIYINNTLVDTESLVNVTGDSDGERSIIGVSDDINPILNFFLYTFFPILSVDNNKLFVSVNGSGHIEIPLGKNKIFHKFNDITYGHIRYFSLNDSKEVAFLQDNIFDVIENEAHLEGYIKGYYNWIYATDSVKFIIPKWNTDAIDFFHINNNNIQFICSGNIGERDPDEETIDCFGTILKEDYLIIKGEQELELAFSPFVIETEDTVKVYYIYSPYKAIWSRDGWNLL